MTELFRKKSIHTLETDRYIKSRVPTWTEVLISSLSVVSILIIFLFFFVYNKKINSDGFLVLEEGETRMVSPITGTISLINKKLYDEVSEGNILFQISNDSNNISLKNKKQREYENITRESELLTEDYHSNIDETNKLKTLYQSQISNVKQERESLIDEKILLENKLILSLKNLEIWQDAAQKGIVNKLLIYDKEQEQFNLNIQLKQIERMLVQNKIKLLELDSLIKKLPNELSALNLSYRSKNNLLQEKANEIILNKSSVVSSPINGQLNTLNVNLGETVIANQLLGTVSKNSNKYSVMFTIADSSSGLVKVGDSVNITLPSFPYQEFGYFNGTIKEISRAPMQLHEIQKYNIDHQSGVNLFKVLSTIDKQEVEKDKKIFQMRNGMKVDIEVVLDKKRLIDWFIEPILKARKKLTIDA